MADLAVVDPRGDWTRARILADAAALAARLAAVVGPVDPDAGPRIVLLCAPGHDFLVGLLAAWDVGAVAVPLHPAHPAVELSALAGDAGVAAVVCSPAHRDLATAVAAGHPVVEASHDHDDGDDGTGRTPPVHPPDRPALMVFTSGTTGRPKGVLHTHGSIAAQVDALLGPWGWTPDDRALLVLPLHHVHGIMAVVLCAWAAGATCEAPGRFDPHEVWERLDSGEITVLMAVPTIYTRLVAAWDAADAPTRRRWSAGAGAARLFVSGSAALPVAVLDRWREITGHTLLERYGMTELGLVLSGTLDRRVPGHVGEPLPGFSVRLVDDEGRPVADGAPGALEVRGPAVFARYWERPDATAEAFTADGWFRTGDVAVHDPEGYRLLGRASVDILKTGGEKVSAIEIEDVYRAHPAVAEGAVVGLPDDEWGQRVVMAVVAAPGSAPADLTTAALRRWGKERLAPAKVPVEVVVLDDLPRNAMGKVLKPALAERLADAPADPSAGGAPA